ncbi:MAG: hypothetical protein Q8922_13200 [Bacteroidota bacterium]|nr:hypothetical protein [Bacteroidota bacterium]MDP4232776.1 hypothetical protein [Bacteroidota bacterium]MDP4242542.1 hypothetical protein [Bacteroidota bacterium]MDP4288879.1 hypothetical protein [Bacteroidota bacterium]
MKEYSELLEDEQFKHGKRSGNLKTALTMLTDMLIELNALEIYYQKPASKAVAPQEIAALREKIEYLKRLLHESLQP